LLYILSGPDDYSLHQSLDEIKRGMGDNTMLSANTTTLDGQQVSPEQLRSISETVPFLAEKRLVIIKGLLERFDPRERANRPKKTSRATDPPDETKAFASGLSRIPESTIIVLIEDKISNSNPLYKEVAGGAVVKTFPLLRWEKLKQWAEEQVRREGGSLSPQAVDLLTRLVGSNLWMLSSEISKLVLFASGRRVEEEDVKSITSYAQQASVFAMVDAIIEFKVELAQQLLQQLLQKGEAPAYLFFMLSRQVGMIVRAGELRKQGTPNIEIQGKLGLTDFALRKTLEQTSHYSLVRLKEVYQQLLATDLAIKTGKYDAEMALNIMVAELCQRGRSDEARHKPGVQHVQSSRL